MTIRLAIVGLGKIAHDQHLPAIAASEAFQMVAAATHAGGADGVPVFRDFDALLASDVVFDAVAMCQPPQSRFDDAAKAIRAGKHVLLEKPPGATLAEVAALVELAGKAGTTLFAAWHSRFAAGVAPARAWLADRRISSVEVTWKEDVRRWHPGQRWIWEPGGFGVFDPGINALSIATAILPEPIVLRGGTVAIPANCASPVAAELELVTTGGAPVRVAFDFLQTGPQTWDIAVQTDDGRLLLSAGGATMAIDGVACEIGGEAEYPALYAHFADLIAGRRSDVDVAPLTLIADAFLRCRQEPVGPFFE